MLAHVTYIQKFIMADSEDEFMSIFECCKCRFCGKQPKTSSGLASGGRRPAGSIKHI